MTGSCTPIPRRYAKFGSDDHAGLWNGTADLWVDLNPAGATSSVDYAISGTTQVGHARFGSTTYPGVWHGTADSWEPLPRPNYPEDQGSCGFSEFLHAEGSSVWTDGNYLYVAGYVTRWFYVAAVLWSRPISSSLSGDFNADNVVDAADYILWRKTDGSQADYNDWRANFGATATGAAAVAHATPVPAVPEPSALLLLACGFARLVAKRRAPTGAQRR